MTIINLRDFFYWYKIDVYIEVSDEVGQELRSDKAYEFTHWRRIKRTNTNYSLDAADDGGDEAADGDEDAEGKSATRAERAAEIARLAEFFGGR